MNVLLSIKPKYVERIADGEKKLEFRKVIFKSVNRPDRIYIYCTSPVKKIMGYFTTGEIFEDDPAELWNRFRNLAGISEEEFFEYFSGKKRGFAISIEDYNEFDDAIDPYDVIPNFTPPQSFCYVDKDFERFDDVGV